MTARPCQRCGKELPRNNRKFCSKECASPITRGGLVPERKFCQICDKEIFVTEGKLWKFNKAKTCSQTCAKALMKARRAEEHKYIAEEVLWLLETREWPPRIPLRMGLHPKTIWEALRKADRPEEANIFISRDLERYYVENRSSIAR